MLRFYTVLADQFTHLRRVLAHDVGATGVDGRCTLKAESLSASRLAHQVARPLSAVWGAAVKAETLQHRRILERHDVRNLCQAVVMQSKLAHKVNE